MGLFKDLKTIFFGASAVTKSAAEKAGDFVKEEGADILSKGRDLAEDAGGKLMDKTSGLKDAIMENSSELIEKTKDKVGGLTQEISSSDTVGKISSVTEDIGEKLTQTGGTIAEKFGEVSENVGAVVMDKGGDALEKGKDLSEEVGGKVLDVKDKLMEKASDVKDQLAEKLDDTMEKANAWEAEQKANPKKDFADDTLDASGSLLEGTDDFFFKADKFASGDYGAFSEGKVSLDTNVDDKGNDFLELPKATGFEDKDGDGNEIIDDAIIDPD